MNTHSITDDLLSAYVDGELEAVDRERVDAWLQSHPEDRARVQAWQADGGHTAVFSCARQLYYPDGRQMPLRDTVGAPDFVDTNCLFLSGAALDLTALWTLMPAPLHIIGDRIFWQALRLSGLQRRDPRSPVMPLGSRALLQFV